MSRPGAGTLLIAAALLVLVADGLLLAGAAWNRRGPVTTLTLTERELALPAHQEEEQSGLQLTLLLSDRPPAAFGQAARIRDVRIPQVEHPWLDRAKLAALGFAVSLDPTDPRAEEHYRGTLPRRVFLLLELEGEAWERWLGAQEPRQLDAIAAADSRAVLEQVDGLMRSRLMVVDADIQAEPLLRKRRSNQLVLPGVLEVRRTLHKERGWVLSPGARLLVDQVHVPAALKPALAPFLSKVTAEESVRRLRTAPGWPEPVAPRYRATVAIGRGHEVWLVGVERN